MRRTWWSRRVEVSLNRPQLLKVKTLAKLSSRQMRTRRVAFRFIRIRRKMEVMGQSLIPSRSLLVNAEIQHRHSEDKQTK